MAKPEKDRAERERARVYQARLQLRASQLQRRRRDTIVAAVVGGLVIVAAIAGQFVYYSAGPGAPVVNVTPAPTSTPTPGVSEDPAPGPTTTP